MDGEKHKADRRTRLHCCTKRTTAVCMHVCVHTRISACVCVHEGVRVGVRACVREGGDCMCLGVMSVSVTLRQSL